MCRFAALVLIVLGSHGLADDKTGQKPADAAKAVIAKFYANIGDGKAGENAGLFFSAEVPVTGTQPREFEKTPVRTLWRKSVKEYLNGHGKEAKYIQVDSVSVDTVHEGLTTTRTSYRSTGARVFSTATLILEAGQWKIASLFEESFFVW